MASSALRAHSTLSPTLMRTIMMTVHLSAFDMRMTIVMNMMMTVTRLPPHHHNQLTLKSRVKAVHILRYHFWGPVRPPPPL